MHRDALAAALPHVGRMMLEPFVGEIEGSACVHELERDAIAAFFKMKFGIEVKP